VVSASDFSFQKLTAADLPFLIEIRNDCRECLHDNREFTLSDCERWFRETQPDFWLIRYCGEPIGYFRLSNYSPDDQSIYIGADLHKSFRGRGLAQQAYAKFIAVLGQNRPISMLKLEVLSHNKAALALYKKLGFFEIGRREHFAERNGLQVDSIVMQKTLSPNGKVTA
jgi:RimJ/RimL family protein N-acetyltransferase